MHIPSYEDMLTAHERIKPHIRRTPVRVSDYLNEIADAELFFKCENFQEPGAFKVRGAVEIDRNRTDHPGAPRRSKVAARPKTSPPSHPATPG